MRFVELMVWGEAEEFVALLLHPLLAMTGARGRGQISAFSIQCLALRVEGFEECLLSWLDARPFIDEFRIQGSGFRVH